MKQIIAELFKKYDIEINENQIEQFNLFYNLLISENEKYNLTGIVEVHEVAEKHFLDCVMISHLFKQNATVCDVGCGAGFPSIPLKIMRPDLKFTLIDSLDKRIKFLNLVISELGLTDIECYHVRSEDFANTDYRGTFDHVTTRAVAGLPTLIEYTLPLLKVGGTAVLMKSQGQLEEVALSQNALKELHGEIQEVYEYNYGQLEYKRTAIVIKCLSKSPSKYPRMRGLPKKLPL